MFKVLFAKKLFSVNWTSCVLLTIIVGCLVYSLFYCWSVRQPANLFTWRKLRPWKVFFFAQNFAFYLINKWSRALGQLRINFTCVFEVLKENRRRLVWPAEVWYTVKKTFYLVSVLVFISFILFVKPIRSLYFDPRYISRTIPVPYLYIL